MMSAARTLDELARAVPTRALHDFTDVPITAITCNSRTAVPGCLFVAIRGFHKDGHDFIPEAIARGAVAVVAERAVPCGGRPLIVVRSTRKALALLATRFYGNPSAELLVTGVTGTNGKTTTVAMLDSINRAAGITSGLISTVAVKTGVRLYPAHLTTPDPVELQFVFAELRDQGITRVAMEVSSQGVEMHRVTGVEFRVGVFTNVTRDHLDFHRSFEHYVRAKTRFARMLPPSGIAALNSDDPVTAGMARSTRARVIAYGLKSSADVAGCQIAVQPYDSTFDLLVRHPLATLSGAVVPPASFPVRISVPGLHNVYNALAAASAALAADLPPKAVQAGLSAFRPVERRSTIFRAGGLLVYDDTALNAGSYDAIIGTAARFHSGRMIVVTAIRGSRGAAVNRDNARVLADWCERAPLRLITTCSASLVGDADRVTVEEEAAFLGVLEETGTPFTHFAELEDAITCALSVAREGDTLLLLGAQGMDAGLDALRRLLAK